ncbi:MAG: transporter substrate-binding domain-containing protein, partial [Magnetococcales bacterium]|nr:transporter substrate-binding domain-containing protein [Magnetococcales bacterium]
MVFLLRHVAAMGRRLPAVVLLLLFSGSLFFPLASPGAGRKPLTVLFTELPPYVLPDEGGEPVGALVDLWRQWSRDVGLPVRFALVSWEEAVARVATGRADILAGFHHPVESMPQLEVIASQQLLPVDLFYRIEAGEFRSLDSLVGRRVGMAIQDPGAVQLVSSRQGIVPVRFSYAEQVVDATLAGEIDAFVMDRATALYYLERRGATGRLARASKPVASRPLYAAVSRHGSAIGDSFRNGELLLPGGDWEAIREGWVLGHVTPIRLFTVNMPPMAFIRDGRPTGLAVEVVQAIMRRLGRDDEIIVTNWEEASRRVLEEPLTALLPPSRTAERESLFQWVGPILPEQLYLFARKGGGVTARTLEEARALRIGVMAGYAAEDYLRRESLPNLLQFANAEEGLKALFAGTIDLWANSNLTLADSAKLAGLDSREIETAVALQEVPGYLAFHREVPAEVVRQWRQALHDIQTDGTYARIVNRWLPRAGQAGNLGSAGSTTFDAREQSWLQEHRLIRLGLSSDLAPFSLISNEGQHQGPAADILDRLGRRFGWHLEVVRVASREGLIGKLRAGNLDLVPGLEVTPDRKVFMRFSRSLGSFPNIVVTPVGGPYLADLGALTGKWVGMVSGNAFRFRLLRSFPALRWSFYPTTAAALDAVSRGDADAFVGNLGEAAYGIQSSGLLDLKIAGRANDFVYHHAFAVRHDWPELASILDKGMAEMGAGEIRRIQRNWESIRIESPTDPVLIRRMALQIGLPAALLMLFFFIWNRRLQQEIGRRQVIEDALVVAKEQAEAASQAKSEFLASMSHEIRTPLNIVIGMGDVLRDSGVTEEQRFFIEKLQSAGATLLGLLDNILDISKIEVGKIEFSDHPLELAPFVTELMEIMAEPGRAKGLAIETEVDPRLPAWIRLDGSRLRQILINLVGNAIKFTDSGFVRLVVSWREQSVRSVDSPRLGRGVTAAPALRNG